MSDKRSLVNQVTQPIRIVREVVKGLSDPQVLKDAGVVTRDEAYQRSAEESARRQGTK